ncbi:MAG: tol-pal system protein YbgF [Thiothrix sp.]|nr:MAG: tol-pal system protein YbgF [Thiothrix sp.]
MCYKLDRSLLGVLVAVMLVAPPVQALNDDVAVQLLERLNDLEGEVSALRNENELLKDKLDGAPTRAEEEEQVKAAAVQAETDDGIPLNEEAQVNQADTNTQPQIPGVNIIVEDAAETADTTDIPALEQEAVVPEVPASVGLDEGKADDSTPLVPAQTEFLTTSPADSTPALLNAGAATVATETAEETTSPEVATSPAAVATTTDTPAEATASASSTTSTPTDTATAPAVDPKSKDSYYYYGTPETEKTTDLKPATAAVPAASAARVSTAASEDGRKAKADYNQAYQLLVNKPADSVPLFRSFLEKYPQHELAANAQYWLAEALYAQKDFEGASKEFMKVLKQYKDSPKSSGAALKLGYSFYELQQWEYARRTLEDTVRFFPDSSSAKLAEARLQKMKEEGH